MKLLILHFPDTEDLSQLVAEMEVTVTHDTISLTGKVLIDGMHMADPPPLEIDDAFRITGPLPRDT